jgi:hypothetical protein
MVMHIIRIMGAARRRDPRDRNETHGLVEMHGQGSHPSEHGGFGFHLRGKGLLL